MPRFLPGLASRRPLGLTSPGFAGDTASYKTTAVAAETLRLPTWPRIGMRDHLVTPFPHEPTQPVTFSPYDDALLEV